MYVLEITTRIGCKVACAYCPQEKLVKNYLPVSNEVVMSLETFKTCINKLPLYVDIHFTGMSEAWLNPEFPKMLQYADKRGHRIALSTTLVGMKLTDVSLLKSVSFKNLWIHLPSKEKYEKIAINENYLQLLKSIYESKINNILFHVQGNIPKQVKDILKTQNVGFPITHSRSGNVQHKDFIIPKRKKGVIGCKRSLYQNVLLPNGDVLICGMDYGKKHVIGNLKTLPNYHSLFQSAEFLKIQSGHKDASVDIICRYCEKFASNEDLSAKFYNYSYNVYFLRNKFKSMLKERLNNPSRYLKKIINWG